MLWLALNLPDLPLRVFERSQNGDLPFAVVEGPAVLLPNRPARARGVYPGLRLSAAQALAPDLRTLPRQPEHEALALRRLAAWALQFTPLVSLQPPCGLLLEVGGSLRLFGGLKSLLHGLRGQLEALGYTAVHGLAPTATGAWLLSRGGDEGPALTLAELRAQLEVLPLEVLTLDPPRRLALEGLGLSSLGDCLNLPRAGLARRLGPELLQELDRALGLCPDPRRPYLPPPRFHAQVELVCETERVDLLLGVLHRLLGELCGFLRGLDSGVQRLSVILNHAEGPATEVPVGLVEPARESDYLLALVAERLERLSLRAPVRALALKAGQIQALTPARPELLGDAGRPRHLWTHLVERLRARLGETAVAGLTTCAEHRPERAWAYTAPGEAGAAEIQGERPLWLLPQPQPLRLKGSQPCWHGPLVLEQGPERIETGWWDGEDVSRDYYIARNPQGARLWVFLERRRREWFLHGLFS